ncbi:MAG: hypothetical protein N2053_08815 [Chitinispirillaceae bacterium]|nr:hypothetical protein [Chitinispirillaceae bacterium]
MRRNIYIPFFVKYTVITIILILSVSNIKGNNNSSEENDTTTGNYQIEKPGTITFTTGSKIVGKVEKPQVMIFLIKEKPIYKEITIERSFKEELLRPLPFLPFTN